MSKVLLVRADGVGDALVCAPLLVALRDAGHEVGALLSTRNDEAFAFGAFAHVHVVERIPWPAHGSTFTSYASALQAARAVGYEVALIASEEPEAYRFAREAGARVRVGFTNGWEKPLKSLWARAQLTRAVVREASAWRVRGHEVETLFRLGAGLHAEAEPTRDPRRLRPLVCGGASGGDSSAPNASRAGAEGFVALQVARKVHADEAGSRRFAAIVASVAERLRAVVFATPADAALAEAIVADSGVEARTFARVTEWRAALCDALAVVTPDSGAAHLAGMAGVPCVDLFEPSPHVACDIVRWRPWAAPSRTIVIGPDAEAGATAVTDALRELLVPRLGRRSDIKEWPEA
ncbi:MAG: glycosyltransferase family 9 protein [Vulcanimicrobiaceae bacterium]